MVDEVVVDEMVVDENRLRSSKGIVVDYRTKIGLKMKVHLLHDSCS